MKDGVGENKVRRVRQPTATDAAEIIQRMLDSGGIAAVVEMQMIFAATGRLYEYDRRPDGTWGRTKSFQDMRHEAKLRLEMASIVRKFAVGDDVKRSVNTNVDIDMNTMLDRKLERLNDHQRWTNAMLVELGVDTPEAGGPAPAALPEPRLQVSADGDGDPEGSPAEHDVADEGDPAMP